MPPLLPSIPLVFCPTSPSTFRFFERLPPSGAGKRRIYHRLVAGSDFVALPAQNIASTGRIEDGITNNRENNKDLTGSKSGP